MARLKQDHPLNNYSLDELSIEFKKLTAESFKDVLMLAGKDVNLENGLQLMHQAILYANLIGGPKGASTSAASAASTTRPATPMAGDQGPQIQNTPGSISTSTKTSSDLEGRLRKMENSFDNLRNQQISDKVTEALKSVRALAGRPNLTPPSVLIAALGFLVECANKASHPG
ncbi:Hypothetical predicted protein [Mytilus galloprovincialis]|uniref:Uncharacterized protein n=1 Tax=Mytilus galloprovincialis TaxID=29158 RepID=A0A8B6FUF7_MYTGA|nr:Hypothetical predicted protein [Mytilus galloprovincialis]